jgi:hypothetical protein
MMNHWEYIRECRAFEEKKSLAELEVAKARVRVAELDYMYKRFDMEYAIAEATERSKGAPS